MESSPRKDTKPRFGLGLQIATVVLLAVTLIFLLPNAFYAPLGQDRETRLANMAHVLPAIVTWCLTGAVLVVSLLIAAYFSVVTMSRALKERPLARRSFVAVFALSAVGFFIYDALWRDQKAAPLQNLYALLGPDIDGLDGIYYGARVMGALGASVSLLVLGAAWALSSWTSQLDDAALRWRGSALASLLSLSSIGLASGAIATSARLQLQIDPALEPEALAWAQSVASAATVGYGGFFTLLLLAVFLPSGWVLRKAGEALAGAARPDGSVEDQQKWLADRGLASSIHARLLSALVALAPLLSSALSSTIAKAFTAAGG